MGKVGDFGLSQKVAPYCIVALNNFNETAPETWGDFYNLKGSTSYDEKSDIFSFSIILWRLFIELRSPVIVRAYPDNLMGPRLRQEIRAVSDQLFFFFAQ